MLHYLTNDAPFEDILIARRMSRIAVRLACRQLKRLGHPGIAREAGILAGPDENRYTEMILRKGLEAVREFGVREAIREIAHGHKLLYMQAALNVAKKAVNC